MHEMNAVPVINYLSNPIVAVRDWQYSAGKNGRELQL